MKNIDTVSLNVFLHHTKYDIGNTRHSTIQIRSMLIYKTRKKRKKLSVNFILNEGNKTFIGLNLCPSTIEEIWMVFRYPTPVSPIPHKLFLSMHAKFHISNFPFLDYRCSLSQCRVVSLASCLFLDLRRQGRLELRSLPPRSPLFPRQRRFLILFLSLSTVVLICCSQQFRSN